MKIVYLSASEIPSRYANSVHVMKMCQAFTKKRYDVTLIGKNGSEKSDNIFDFYGVKKIFKIKLFNWPNKISGPFFYLYQLKYFLKNLDKKNVIVYGRASYGIYLSIKKGFRSVYEAHSLPTNRIHYFFEREIIKSKN